jgi:hypothetical protein
MNEARRCIRQLDADRQCKKRKDKRQREDVTKRERDDRERKRQERERERTAESHPLLSKDISQMIGPFAAIG